jgi:hypothetical protein
MSELQSDFSRPDVETLIESMDDWEGLGNSEFHFMNMIESMPMPPEEAGEAVQKQISDLKEHFRRRKPDIEASRMLRQEKATFLKAKLMLVRKDMAVDGLFNMADNAVPEEAAPPRVEKKTAATPDIEKRLSESVKALEHSEYFIKDLGVWKHYEDFLAKKKDENS